MLKHIPLVLGLATACLATTPSYAFSCYGVRPDLQDWCRDIQRNIERNEDRRRHEELMDELDRPRQCFSQRDNSGQLFTWCN